ncbi:heme-degrading domain-containing protein [Pengzhenrongella phosphoraccumulans]|uniref:heme-degrading domain-containing protein n=1 Tax=Pengzhenrongella phosphoraccumulans TaxID=3114394 RepID=UPI00388CF8D1
MTTAPDPAVLTTIASLEAQERELVFARFDNADAWRLGCLLVELAQERELGITIDVRRGTQQLFHAALPGTVADNDTWVERKVRVVERFGASSYLVGLRSVAKGTTFAVAHDLPLQQYAAHGGCFPVRIADVGVVGTVTVSGLAQADDHALVVEALRTFLS